MTNQGQEHSTWLRYSFIVSTNSITLKIQLILQKNATVSGIILIFSIILITGVIRVIFDTYTEM